MYHAFDRNDAAMRQSKKRKKPRIQPMRRVCKVFSLLIPLEVVPQTNAEIGIKVKEFGNKFKVATALDKK